MLSILQQASQAGFACVLDYATLYCPNERTINIDSAFYGSYATPCNTSCCVATSDDCTESIQGTAPVEWEALLLMCQGQEICSVENAGRVLTTCNNSPNNYLIITYSCLPGILFSLPIYSEYLVQKMMALA